MSERIPRALIVLLGALAIVLFFASTLQRLPSPIELGSGEGTLMDHAIRFAAGLPVYGPPSFEFIPLAYMPGVPLLAAPLVHWFGPQFWIGRGIDIAFAAALCALIVWALRRECGRWSTGVAAAGIFLMGQGFTLGCYDVFRPDVVMLFLAVAGAATVRYTTGVRGAAAAGFLFGLSFVAKQHGLVFGLAMLPYLWFADRRRLVPYAVFLALFAGGFFLLLRAWLGPWFTFYVLDVPRHWSEFSRHRIQHYVTQEAFGRFAMLTVPATLALATRPWRERAGVWWWMAFGGFGTGLMATLDPYAFLHTMMPSLLAYALVGPLALERLLEAGFVRRRTAFTWAAAAVIAVQFAALPFSPRALRPRPGGAAALHEFTDFLRRQGRAAVVFHGFYTSVAGMGTGLSILPLDDVVRSHGNSLLRRDPGYFDRMFARWRSGPGRPVIVSDTTLAMTGDVSRPYWASLVPGYRLVGTLGDLANRLRPVVGEHDTPRYVYVPVDPDSSAAPADSTR